MGRKQAYTAVPGTVSRLHPGRLSGNVCTKRLQMSRKISHPPGGPILLTAEENRVVLNAKRKVVIASPSGNMVCLTDPILRV
jgi:hypothetical protein